jgi:hypothetical protein
MLGLNGSADVFVGDELDVMGVLSGKAMPILFARDEANSSGNKFKSSVCQAPTAWSATARPVAIVVAFYIVTAVFLELDV